MLPNYAAAARFGYGLKPFEERKPAINIGDEKPSQRGLSYGCVSVCGTTN